MKDVNTEIILAVSVIILTILAIGIFLFYGATIIFYLLFVIAAIATYTLLFRLRAQQPDMDEPVVKKKTRKRRKR